MASVTEDILNSISQWIANLVSRVSEWLWDNFKPVFEKISGWIDTVFNRLKNIAVTISNFIEDIWESIQARISSLVDDAINFIREVFDRVSSSITSLFDSATSYLGDAFNSVVEQITDIATGIKSWITETYDSITNAIKSITETVVTWVKGLFEDVKLAISSIIERAALVVDALVQGIQDFIHSVVETVGVALRELLEATAKLPAAISDLGSGFAEAVEKFIGSPISSLPSGIWSSLTEHVEKLTKNDQERLIEAIHQTYLSPHSPPKNNDELREMYNMLIPESGIMRGVFLTIFGLLGLVMSIAGITSAASQIMVQEFGITSPYTILQPADAIRAYHYGLVDREETIMTLRRHGHGIEDANRIMAISKETPTEGDLLSWWLRGFISEDELDSKLKRRAWSDDNIKQIKRAVFFIPPVQDLITMAVREVFTPEIAERFGQFEDYPPDFSEHAKKQGISEEWARNYWAAHWALPSPQMGYEMLHRGVISEEDLALLMKALDVMPFWRDKLIQISYAPYTRVDIRRMHKVGVLSEAEVHRAYMDIGYNDERATRLTEFTVQLNEPSPVDDDDEINKLTRAGILNFYGDGILTRERAKALLKELGNSEAAAELYLVSADLDIQRDERKQETDLILDKFKAGILSYTEAEDAVNALGLQTAERDRVMTKLLRQQAATTKIPSRADLDKMLAAELITEDDYIQNMQLNGYSDKWAGKYLQLVKGA